MFSVCVAAVKCRTVLHHCVVVFWSSWIMYCMLLMQTFLDLRGPLMAECTCRWTHQIHYYWQRLIRLRFNYSHKNGANKSLNLSTYCPQYGGKLAYRHCQVMTSTSAIFYTDALYFLNINVLLVRTKAST